MRKIGLISCSKTKCKEVENDHNLAIPAKDFYVGRNFKKAVNEGLQHFGCEDYFILSGKYGLLDKDEKISYYDCYLTKQPKAYRGAWAERVYCELQTKFGDLNNIQFVFFAGSSYYKNLSNRLNCIMLIFNGQHMTFEIKEEHFVQG